MVTQLDDYRRTPRLLTRHELALLQTYDPLLNGCNVFKTMSIVLEQTCHDIQMHKYPKHQAQIIPLVKRVQRV